MPAILPKPDDAVREIKIMIGDEWQHVRFAKPLPLVDAVARAQQILDTFKEFRP